MSLLVEHVFYAREATLEKVTTVTLRLGYPESVKPGQSSVAICVELDGAERLAKHAFGVDGWQALMIAISMLRLDVQHLFRKAAATFYYTREDAERQTHAVALDEFFPKNY